MILTSLLFAAAQGTTPAAAPPRQETSPATAEGIEILRRLLVQAVNREPSEPRRLSKSGRFADRYGLVTQLWLGDTVSHSRGFHVPGLGAFFALDVQVPVVEAETGAESGGDAPSKEQDDEWEKTRREVQRGHDSSGSAFQLLVPGDRAKRRVEFDGKEIDRLVEEIVKTLSRHAARVEGLSSQDWITVALHLSADHDPTVWSGFRTFSQDSWTDVEKSDEDEPETAVAYAVSQLDLEVAQQELVIRVQVGDLGESTDGGLPRGRVKINRY